MSFDTKRYKLLDKITGEKVPDNKAELLMTLFVLRKKEKDIKENILIVEDALNEIWYDGGE